MSAKLAGTSLLESGSEDRPFDGKEFHIFNILETPKNCRALIYALLIVFYMILHAASPLLQLKIKEVLH